MSKLTIRSAIAAVALAALSFSAQADADVPNVPDDPYQAPSEYCSGMALLAEKVAETRDHGVAYQPLALLMSFLENPYHREDAGYVVELAYSHPYTPADRLASQVFEDCFNFYTTKV